MKRGDGLNENPLLGELREGRVFVAWIREKPQDHGVKKSPSSTTETAWKPARQRINFCEQRNLPRQS